VRSLILLLLLTACAKPRPDLYFAGSENRFSQTEEMAFGGEAAIENSFIRVDGETYAFFDPNATGAMKRRNMRTGETIQVLDSGARFSYVIELGSMLLNFVTINGQIYKSRSLDGGLTWIDQHKVQEAPMVQWNPGVAIDASGKWHMLIEADETGLPNQAGAGCYYYASDDGSAWTSRGRAIDKCGNPFLAATSQGLLVIHGDLTTGVWQTTASTFDGSKWETHRDAFLIHSPGVHVCDPHAIEDEGRIILSVSVDQNSITLTEAIDGFEDLHRRLISYGSTGTF